MSQGPTRRRTGATLADVWPAAPVAPRATHNKNERRRAQLGAPDVDARANEPAPGPRQIAAERTIARRDQRISTETFEGKLLAHGPARYRFQITEGISYFARLLTAGGIVNLWGRGIEQAIERSTTHVRVGDRVAFRRLEHDPRTGRVLWRAEKPEWFAAQDKDALRRRDEQIAAQRAARDDPELARAMLPLKAAKALAQRRLSDPKQRLQFIAGVAARLTRTEPQQHPASDSMLRSQSQNHTPSDASRARRSRDPDRTR
ncbi:MAG TPA: hypothetical protein VGE08_00060 [Steroidobacter sp.]|uniref:hypothetical protein n=1 Tax=Steroidobacter sp. TaxID=1978227 RepID=UPI002ED9EEB4